VRLILTPSFLLFKVFIITKQKELKVKIRPRRIKKMKLEVIATSIADVKAISQSQADRIEYCHTMVDGGLTPKIKEVKQALLLPDHQPINVMIRPNAKSFAYS